MDLSGIIFVVLAVAWAVFLIPKALQHHDELARTRSIDRFSASTRVLARREPVNDRDARLVVTPARRTRSERVTAPLAPAAPLSDPIAPVSPVASVAPVPTVRAAARAAARRRRRILVVLLLGDLGTAVAAYLGRLPWLAVAIPAVLTLAYLVLCRTQVRHETARPVPATPVATRRPATRAQGIPAQGGKPAEEQLPSVVVEEPVDEYVGADRVAEFDDTEDTAGFALDELRAAVLPEGGSTLWDPLPVTLPTYVTKAKANRTVRTIDLGEPGTWTSGRSAADSEVVAKAADDRQAKDEPQDGGARAIGS